MDADLDTLATAVYVKIDDLLAAEPHRAPWRPAVGIAPQITDAELLTLAVMQVLLSQPSEARWLRYTHAYLRRLFPYLFLTCRCSQATTSGCGSWSAR